MKSLRIRYLVWLSVLGVLAPLSSAPAFTLIVAPARYSVLQVAFDVLQQYPSVLVSYQSSPNQADPVLHAWNGSEWVLVTMKDYREVNFLESLPDRTILIGDASVLPDSLVEASSWAPGMNRVTALDTATLVNELGRSQGWTDAVWKWFAARYGLSLADEAAERRQVSWYEQQHGPLPDRPRLLPGKKAAKTLVVEPLPAAEPVAPPMEVDVIAPVDASPVAPVDLMPPAMEQEPAVSVDPNQDAVPAGESAPVEVVPGQP